MRRATVGLCPLVAALCFVAAPDAHAQICGTFLDEAPTGWSLYGNENAPVWSPTGGNSGGCMTAQSDAGADDVWGFVAPAAVSEFCSLTGSVFLNWDIKTDAVDLAPAPAPDIAIESPGGVIVLRFEVAPIPNEWTTRSVRLDEFSPWRLGSVNGPVADRAQIQSVVTSATAIRFRAGYSGTSDTERSAIDNLLYMGCPCTADFDGDGDTGTDTDIYAFFACLGGHCCATCGSADYDGDGDTGTDVDIEMFFRVLGGGC